MNLYRVKGYYSTVSETVGEIVQSTANENLQAMGNNAAGVSKTLSNHKRCNILGRPRNLEIYLETGCKHQPPEKTDLQKERFVELLSDMGCD